jgi:hypothetical protein
MFHGKQNSHTIGDKRVQRRFELCCIDFAGPRRYLEEEIDRIVGRANAKQIESMTRLNGTFPKETTLRKPQAYTQKLLKQDEMEGEYIDLD